MTDLIPPPSSSGKALMARVEDALLPLINLVFLLLMFFIVAGQIADNPLPELPPTGAESAPVRPDADLVVTADGDWRVDGDTLSAERLLTRLPAPSPQHPLKVAAAAAVSMAELETLFRTLEQHGYTEILLLTEPAT